MNTTKVLPVFISLCSTVTNLKTQSLKIDSANDLISETISINLIFEFIFGNIFGSCC